MALDADDLASEILANLGLSNPDLLVAWKKITNAIVDHIVGNLEINGVTVDDPESTVETFDSGTGDHGGALETESSEDAIVGNVKKGAQTLNQNNDGTGLVA